MYLSAVRIRRAAVLCTMIGALWFSAAPASAEPPPNCTAADRAGVAAGVSAAMWSYLVTHPDVNAFLTGLKGQPRDGIRDQVQAYLNANPQTRDELTAIRQPLTDLRNRCGNDASTRAP
ncbi:heme-binding protein [Mycolicibacterium sp. 050158]|uniref:heme-binding protein n=1 Tax=Mycolicibacterium sp. 050158 TaxID=3090602 RepID=UPI00299D7E90|nr:heme-binding protein [Mycolicibacterium sp. 050158]MDX1891448.1 heme-binding protein [Mycolicibacterium sp. 050158]